MGEFSALEKEEIKFGFNDRLNFKIIINRPVATNFEYDEKPIVQSI